MSLGCGFNIAAASKSKFTITVHWSFVRPYDDEVLLLWLTHLTIIQHINVRMGVIPWLNLIRHVESGIAVWIYHSNRFGYS